MIRYLMVLLYTAQAFCFSGYQEPWGKEHDLHYVTQLPEKRAPNLAVRLADALIWFHQTVISPVDGPRSHYRPSSSQYMKIAMHEYGFVRGFIMGCDRLLRENDEEWVYRKIEQEGQIFKYDPAHLNKYK